MKFAKKLRKMKLCPTGINEKSTNTNGIRGFLVRETGLEPVRGYHTPLKRARLPIPPLSRVLK